jgi:hypothetical protein
MTLAKSTVAVLIALPMIAGNEAQVAGQGLTVHEWGTFTSVAAADGSAEEWDALGGENDLPGFVNNGGYRCTKWRLTGTVRMETPVIYFYSQRDVDARVTVKFPHGVITEWYPNAENSIYESKTLMDQMSRSMQSPMYSEDAIYQTASLLNPLPRGLGETVVKLSPSRNGIDTSLGRLMSAISWKDIHVRPDSTAKFPAEKSPSRYYAARETDAAPITAGDQQEKFLFYRGVGRFAIPLSARLSDDGKIVVENRGIEAIPSVILFESRGGHVGYRNVGAIQQQVATLERPALDASLSQLLSDLETQLAGQGLYRKEAHAMVETWRDSWFEEGSRLIYIVPASAVDAALPLQIDPIPEKTARVFVGRIELITTETKRAVEEAVQRGDPSGIPYERFLDPILKRIYPGNASQVNHIEQSVHAAFSPGRCR